MTVCARVQAGGGAGSIWKGLPLNRGRNSENTHTPMHKMVKMEPGLCSVG